MTSPQMTGLDLVAAGGAGSVILDESSGLIPTGVTVTGGPNTSLLLIGTNGNDSLGASSSQLNFDRRTISFGGVSNVGYDPGAGTNNLNLAGGTLTLAAPAAGAGATTRLFSVVSIGAGATLAVQSPVIPSDRSVIITPVLSIAGTINSWTGRLDLGNNDLIVRNGNLAQIQNQITSGSTTADNWTGQGIISSAAANDSSHLTTLGVMLNNNGYGSRVFGVGAPAGPFDGQDAASGDILVKYTYFGDTNLDGVVDGSDCALIDNAFNNQAAGLSPSAAVNFTTGFANAGTSITTNGNTSVNGHNLQLLPNTAGQTGSAYYAATLGVSHFSTDITFTQNAGAGDGFIFVFQNSGSAAPGGGGGSLGYAGIDNSLAIKFDLYDNNGEGDDSTGLYLNGSTPTVANSIDLSSTGINLHSGDSFRAAVNYAGSALNVTLTDLNTGA